MAYMFVTLSSTTRTGAQAHDRLSRELEHFLVVGAVKGDGEDGSARLCTWSRSGGCWIGKRLSRIMLSTSR